MAPQQKERLRALTAEEQGALEQVRQATSGRHDAVQRAAALLAVAAGARFAAAARGAGYAGGSTVHALVKRFNARGLAAVAIAPGRGPRVTYDAATRAQVVALAQRQPDRKLDGTATWSLSTLERAVRREIFPAPSARTIAQILRDAGSSYQKTRTWCPTGTAERKRKDGVVRVVDPLTEAKRGRSTRRTG
jgi:transposase